MGERESVILTRRHGEAEISAEKTKNRLGGTSRICGFRGTAAEIADEEESELCSDWQAEACPTKRKIL